MDRGDNRDNMVIEIISNNFQIQDRIVLYAKIYKEGY